VEQQPARGIAGIDLLVEYLKVHLFRLPPTFLRKYALRTSAPRFAT
jgi:hypothetical protein